MYDEIARQFYDEMKLAMALMGSHARGEAQQYSDIDLVCLIDANTTPPAETYYIDNQLVVVSYVSLDQTEHWFTEPKQIIEVISNLRQAKILIDEQGLFAALQKRAELFKWTEEHQAKANLYAGNELVGLIEEVHKGLNCLTHYHVGRFINATHGLVWGLTNIMLVFHGVLANGDNGLIDGAQQAAGIDSEWSRLHRLSFGITPSETLEDRLRASLELYKQTYEMCKDVCNHEQQQLINRAISLIDNTAI